MLAGLAVFDMDGVVADSEAHWFTAELAYISSQVSGWNGAAQRQRMGRPAIETYQLLKRDYGLELGAVEFLRHIEGMAETIYTSCTIDPGLAEALDELTSTGCRLALCTSSSQRWADMLLSRLGPEPRFDPILTSSSFHGPGKPSPDVYTEVLSRAGFPVSRAVVVEDSPIGVTAAKNAGVHTIGYMNGFNTPSELGEADSIAASMKEVVELVTRFLSE